jgi:hypothetical protein
VQREIRDAVERALREYESQHPPAAEPPRATPQKPDPGSDQRPDRKIHAVSHCANGGSQPVRHDGRPTASRPWRQREPASPRKAHASKR